MLHGGRKWEIRRSLLMTAAVVSVGSLAAVGARPAAADHDGNVKLINTIYRDIVIRPAKPDEIPGWAKWLDKGLPVQHVAGQIMRLQKHRNQQVQSAFMTILGRDATKDEITQYGTELFKGRTYEHVKAEIFGLDEVYDFVGDDVDAWVDFVFTYATGAPPDSTDHDAFAMMLSKRNNPQARQKVARLILNLDDSYDYFVRTKFKKFVRRFPTQAEVDALVQMFKDKAREEDVIAEMMATSDYYDWAQIFG